jgi:hypothetical protein
MANLNRLFSIYSISLYFTRDDICKLDKNLNLYIECKKISQQGICNQLHWLLKKSQFSLQKYILFFYFFFLSRNPCVVKI